MAQRHHDLTDSAAGAPVTGDALAGYLRARATEFLRALRLQREGGSHGGTDEAAEAARALRRSARRISGSLHTFRALLDADWSEEIRPELAWLSGTLALEHAYEARLERLLLALQRLSGATAVPVQGAGGGAPLHGTAHLPDPAEASTAPRTAPGTAHPPAAPRTVAGPPAASRAAGSPPGTSRAATAAVASRAAGSTSAASRSASAPADSRATGTATASAGPVATAPGPVNERGTLTVGAAKAGALLDRQLTLARTRAHSTALQALGSSRFHAVADKVAVLASEVPLTPDAPGTDLAPLATAAEERLTDAVAALPLVTAGHPYNAEALVHGLSPDTAPHPQDAPWHQVRLLLRLHRYALEVLHGGDCPPDVRLIAAGEALDRHRDASEAAAAAAQAARTPRIAPATAYALGVLHADQRHEVEAARYAFQRAWQRPAVHTA
ncbi:CHAD domain-containing protein [Streptomyces longwoodensis]|uniref:CHAD domain-containing protein n=1 Tax=Streptomyces longwoodensis TaxID=68231 RepID=UPI0030E39B96|nr:CHAD domain-containing protein [Streptomyces longwoodensis]